MLEGLKKVEFTNYETSRDYYVSDCGTKVYSLNRQTGFIKQLKIQSSNAKGYQHINIYTGERRANGTKKNKTIMIHKMVVSAFMNDGIYLTGFNQHINHIDGNPANNDISNLEIVKASDNILHGYLDNVKLSYISYVTTIKCEKYVATPQGIRLGIFTTEVEASQAVYNYFKRNDNFSKYARYHKDIVR